MAFLPTSVRQALEACDGPVIPAMVNPGGPPNVICAACRRERSFRRRDEPCNTKLCDQ